MASPYNQFPHGQQPQRPNPQHAQNYPSYPPQGQQPGDSYNVHNQPPLGQQLGFEPNQPKKDNTAQILIGVFVCLTVLIFAVAVVGLFLVGNKDNKSSPGPVAAADPSATPTPEGTFLAPTMTVTSTPTWSDISTWARQNRDALNGVTALINATINAITKDKKFFGKTMRDLREVTNVSDQLTSGHYRELYQDNLTLLSKAANHGIIYYATGEKKDYEKFRKSYSESVALWSVKVKALNLVLEDNEKLDTVNTDG